MRFKSAIGILILTSSLFAFNDSDLDGVEDGIDICPDSGILDLVDRNGCSKNQIKNNINKSSSDIVNSKNNGYLEFGINSDFTNIDEKYNYYKLSFAYKINNYDFFISDSNYELDNKSYNDLTLSLGYSKIFDKFLINYNVGTTIYIDWDKDNTYFMQLAGNYTLSNRDYIFFGATYTVNSKEQDYTSKDYLTFNFRYGNYVNSKLLLSSSINYESKVADELNSSLWVDVIAEYSISNGYYINTKYSRYLKGDGQSNSLSLNLGVRF